MTNVRKDHTMEFPMPAELRKPSLLKRLFRLIHSGHVYSGDK